MLKQLRYFLRRALHAKKLANLRQLAQEFGEFSAILSSQEKYEIDLLIRPYAHKGAKNTCECLRKDLEFFLPLLGKRAEFKGFKIYLNDRPRVISEGIFCLIIDYENQPLYSISLSIVNNYLLISCAQGLCEISSLKAATKAASGLRPINLALNIAQNIAERANLNLAGVKNSSQISQFKRRKNDFINYDELWQENAQITAAHEHFFALKIARKEMEQIASKKRAEYRRRYEIIDQLTKDFYEA